MPPKTSPTTGWQIQTTASYRFTTSVPAVSIPTSVAIPVVLDAALISSLRRSPFCWLVVPGAITLLAGVHRHVVAQSSYGEDRNLPPMSVPLIVLVGLGGATLAVRHIRLALVIVFDAATVMAYSGHNERERFAASADTFPN